MTDKGPILNTIGDETGDTVGGTCSCGVFVGRGQPASVQASFARHVDEAHSANGRADRATYKNLVAEAHVAAAGAAYELAKAPPSDKLVAHAVDPEQLCGTCLHRRKRHLADQQCTLRDVHTGQQCGCTTFLDGPPDIEDPTNDPRVDQLPAVTTSMDPAQFRAWLDSAGDMFVVYLPGQQSFVIKVPDEHNAFFVAMMQQVRFCLGNDVKAVRMQVVSGPPADAEAPSYAPGTDPEAYQRFTEAGKAAAERFAYHDDPDVPDGTPTMDYAPGTPRKVKCAGSGKPAKQPHPTGFGARGICDTCGHSYKLTGAGNVRVHNIKA